MIDDVVAGVLGIDPHAADDFAQAGGRVAHHDRAVPVGLGLGRGGLEQGVAQEVVGVEHQARLLRLVDEDDPFPARGVEPAQEGVLRRALERRQHRPAPLDRQLDHAQGVDRLALVAHRDVVEVEEIERAGRLQAAHLAAARLGVAHHQGAEVALAEQADPLRPEPGVEQQRGGLGDRVQQHAVERQDRAQARRHAQGVAGEVGLGDDLAEQGDHDGREQERPHPRQHRVRQQREQHVDRDVAPQHRGEGEVRVAAQLEHRSSVVAAAGGLDFEAQPADAEDRQVEPGEHSGLADAQHDPRPGQRGHRAVRPRAARA